MSVYEIKAVSTRESQKNLVLANRRGSLSNLAVHRFAVVGPGDQIHLEGTSTAQKVLVHAKSVADEITVLPRFENHREIRLGGERLNVIFTEISSATELREYRRLEQFHYKGVELNTADPREGRAKGSGGRKAVLIALFQKGGIVRALGYIEIQMPLLMCKPRHDLFSRPFTTADERIKWNTWLGDGQKFVNRIARIARVVVDPEFRGVGVSTLLVEEAKSFCRDRWHIGGERPIFLEISAEMLRYMDFVSRAGLHFVGNTEGNLKRISKDLSSMENGAGGKSGIMSLQRKYHAAFTAYCEKTGRSFNEARLILSELLQAEDPRSEMASNEWLAFRPILRFPIPYFIGGLDPESDAYVTEGLKANSDKKEKLKAISVDALLPVRTGLSGDTLDFEGIEVSVSYEIPLSPYVRMIMDSFGIDTNKVHTRIVGPIDVSLSRGTVALITGASGAGKSVLLQALSGLEMPQGLRKTAQEEPTSAKCRMLAPLPDGVPIFQYFADLYGPERAFDALCHVGLSEAMIFIKPFELLSVGQRYRAMFADLILSDADLWLIDEFCSNLDPITSKILATRLRRLALRKGCFVVVAAANTMHFIDALVPDRIFVVRTGGEVNQMTMKDYNNGFYNKGF